MRAGLLHGPDDRAISGNEKWLIWLTSAFFTSLFLPPNWPIVSDILMAALVLICFLFNRPAEKVLLLRYRIAILFLIFFFLLQLISAAVSINHARAWSVIGMRSPLLVFPLALGGVVIRQRLRQLILLAFAVIVLSVSLCCLIDAIHRAWVLHDTQWLYDDSLTKLIGRTAVYMALIVALAIFSFAYLLERRLITGRAKAPVYAAIGFLLIFHFLLASRTSLFFLYASILGYGCWRIAHGAKIGRLLSLMAAGLLVGLLLVAIFPKTLNRFRQLEYLSYDYHSRGMESHYNMAVTPDQWNSANFRLAVWNCGLDIARRHLLTGVPLGDKQAVFAAEYKSRGFMFAFDHHRNLHNTWLDVLVNTGIPGLLIFLLGYLILPLRAAIKNADWLGMLIIGMFATAMATETWIDSSFGSVLLGFWLSLVIAWQPPAPVPAAPALQDRVLPRCPADIGE